MSLFGDITERLELNWALGTMKEQLTRIAKLLALRKFVKHSKLHSKIDPDAKLDKQTADICKVKMKQSSKEKKKRDFALEILNSDNFMLDTKMKRDMGKNEDFNLKER